MKETQKWQKLSKLTVIRVTTVDGGNSQPGVKPIKKMSDITVYVTTASYQQLRSSGTKHFLSSILTQTQCDNSAHLKSKSSSLYFPWLCFEVMFVFCSDFAHFIKHIYQACSLLTKQAIACSPKGSLQFFFTCFSPCIYSKWHFHFLQDFEIQFSFEMFTLKCVFSAFGF